MGIRAVLFDMDGTIWHNPVDWAEVRRRVGLAPGPFPIAHHLKGLPPEEREAKEGILRDAEAEGVRRGRLLPGAEELISWLKGKGVRTALVTNNSRESLESVLSRHPLPFDHAFSREEIPLKPDPRAFLIPLVRMGIPPSQACVVGDSHMDLLAAVRAGVREVVLVAPRAWMRDFFPDGVEFHEVGNLSEAKAVLERLLGEEGGSVG